MEERYDPDTQTSFHTNVLLPFAPAATKSK